jgi:hypothetical protein
MNTHEFCIHDLGRSRLITQMIESLLFMVFHTSINRCFVSRVQQRLNGLTYHLPWSIYLIQKLRWSRQYRPCRTMDVTIVRPWSNGSLWYQIYIYRYYHNTGHTFTIIRSHCIYHDKLDVCYVQCYLELSLWWAISKSSQRCWTIDWLHGLN